MMTREVVCNRSNACYRRIEKIDLDFEPIYCLTPDQYNRLVNGLFNLLIATISGLEEKAEPVPPQEIIEQARDIFADYDDDLADILMQCIIASGPTDDAPSPTLTGDDICID